MPVPARYTFVDERYLNGGMSQVRVFTDTHLERLVVIKTLLPGRERRRLLDEIVALQGIRSPHVVQVYDVFRNSDGDVEGIIEELVSGPQFADSDAPNNTEEFLKLVYPLAAGIDDIHSAGVIHRDIKPSNIKFDEEGCLKIFDFGLARGQDADAQTRGAVGSIGYMAPELYYDYAGGIVYFTTAVDVYAFGVTALYSVLKQVPRPLRRHPPVLPCVEADFTSLPINLPPDVAEILNSCLSESPRNRPTMTNVRALIGRHLLRNKHRALLAYTGTTYLLNVDNPRVRLSAKSGETIDVRYDGLDFLVSSVSGHVFINNVPAIASAPLPGSCVIAMGDPMKPSSRTFITVDVAHPEVAI